MNTQSLRAAAAQYPLEFLDHRDAFGSKVTRWVGEAAGAGASLLVLPEYFSIELTSTFGSEIYSSLPRQLAEMQRELPAFLSLFDNLARQHALYICAGSYPVAVAGAYCNRSYFFSPQGQLGFQDKLQMTRFERERWHISAGRELKVFATDVGQLAINICYDCEFPLLARRQVEQGAEIILVPSCTDTLAGFHRVKIGCQARALENQCYVVQSPTVGECAWSEAIDNNVGLAAMYVPPDYGFPADGILAAGALNAPQWVYADLALDDIARVRAEGQVFNHRDWERQCHHLD